MKPAIFATSYEADDVPHRACLLVLDDRPINVSALGEAVRNLIDCEPLTRDIYVVAPSLSERQLKKMLIQGLPAMRASATDDSAGPRFLMVDLRLKENRLELQALPIQGSARIGARPVRWQTLDPALTEGWLISLFRVSNAMVHAPHGVHFWKSSGRHSKAFLRASSTLMNTAVCGLLALVALSKVRNVPPRRIFVDTAPLLTIAYSMYQVASTRKLWDLMPPATSFSSYGGAQALPKLGAGDLVLLSASTSGGLAEEILNKGAREDMLATLFFLGKDDKSITKGALICDLLGRQSKADGFPPLKSYPAESCEFCRTGDVLAELQGDQFLIDKREVKLLRLTGDIQQPSSRQLFNQLCRTSGIKVRLNHTSRLFTRFELSEKAILSEQDGLGKEFARLISRFAPLPLDFIVLVGLSEVAVKRCMVQFGMSSVLKDITFVNADSLDSLPAPSGAKNFLVLFSVLEDHSLARTINATLRSKSKGGNVAYISGLTIAASARAVEDLRIFLSYGSRGPDTFTFKSAKSLLLPYIGEEVSSWMKERAFLQRLGTKERAIPQIARRLQLLSMVGTEHENLFFPGYRGPLAIKPDFVFLDTNQDTENVSQADVLAVVGNVMACARAGKNNVQKPPERGTPTWKQSALYQVLLCPSNFRDFNDPILRAALLRTADEQEMNYAVDDTSSEEMSAILLSNIAEWKKGAGDALPEFMLALSTGRLRLASRHSIELSTAIKASNLPKFMHALASGFMESARAT